MEFNGYAGFRFVEKRTKRNYHIDDSQGHFVLCDCSRTIGKMNKLPIDGICQYKVRRKHK